jgi:FkbM family methyltransferase
LKKSIVSLAAFAARALPLSAKQALYKIPALARFLRGSINAATENELTEVEIAAGDLRGYKILLNLQKEKSRWLGTYEPELAEAVREFVRPGNIIYDVGANIGYVSMLLAHAARPNGKVFAFEALPANIERIRRNVAHNALESRVTLIGQAVTDQRGEVTFHVHASVGMGKAEGSAGRKDEAYLEQIRVPSISLDEFIYTDGNPAPDIIKIDIEGGEVLALPGMKRLLTEKSPILLLELHGPQSEQVAWNTLTGAGYTLHAMQAGYPKIETPDQLGWKAYVIAKKTP